MDSKEQERGGIDCRDEVKKQIEAKYPMVGRDRCNWRIASRLKK
jgi:hypothetical protein